MGDGRVVLGLLLAAAALGPSLAQAAEDDWPMFRGDAARTGSPFDAASGGTGASKWKVALVNESESSPALARSRVFIGSEDGNLTALYASNGTKNWTYEVGVRVTSSPVVVELPIPDSVRSSFRWAKDRTGDLVMVGDSAGVLHGVRAYDGVVWWTYHTTGEIAGGPAVMGERVFVASRDGTVHALSAAVGDLLWARELGGEVLGSVVAADGRVYVGSWDRSLYALDARTGAVDWSFDAGSRIYGSPAVAEGTVVVGTQAGRIVAVDAADGSEVWSYEADGLIVGAPALRAGRVFVGSLDEYLYALRLDNGDVLWKTRVKPTSSPAASGPAVFVGTVGAVVAVSAEAGAELWRTTLAARFDSSPAVANGTLFIASSRIGLKQGADDHHVYALDAGAPTADGDPELPTSPPDGTPTDPTDGTAPGAGEDEGEGGGEEGGLPLPVGLLFVATVMAAALRRRRR